MDMQPAGIGHNNPPPDTEQSPFDKLMASAAELITLGNRWQTERPSIIDADMASKAGAFRDKLKAVHDGLDKLRLEEKREFEAWLRERFGATLDLLAKARAAIVDKIEVFRRAEQRKLDEERERADAEVRRQREEAEQARRAAEAAQATPGTQPLQAQQAAEAAQRQLEAAQRTAAAMPTKALIKVEGGRTISGRTIWKARITDADKAIAHYADHAVMRQAMADAALRIADAEAKLVKDATKAPAGVEFYPDTKAA